MNKKELLLKKINILNKMQENKENMVQKMVEEQNKQENKEVINHSFADRSKKK